MPPRQTKGRRPPPGDPPPGNAPPAPVPGPVDIVPAPAGPPPAPQLEAIVAELRLAYVAGAVSAALHMAQVLLRAVGGDEERLARGKEDPTLRAIAEHPTLGFSDWVLWSAIGVFFQWPLLPEAIREELSLAHHRLLLAIPNPGAKRQLASRAASQDWPSRRLSDEVRRWRATHHLPPVGRPQHHPVIASLRRAVSSARTAADAAEEGELPSELRAEAERLERLAAKHLARLRAALAPPKAPSGGRREGRKKR